MAFIADAALGSVISELLKVVLDVAKQTLNFKSNLKTLETTLESVKLVFDQIEELHKALDRPKEETEHFIAQLTRGLDLVHKCSTIKKWNVVNRYSQSRKLVELDKCIVKFFNVDVQGLVAVNSLKTVIGVDKSNVKLDLILGYFVNNNGSFGADRINSVGLDLILNNLGVDDEFADSKEMVLKDEVRVETTLPKVLYQDPHIQTHAFVCKTCNKHFSTFQALGGHRTIHKKPGLVGLNNNLNDHKVQEQSSPAKPKVYECSICGRLEFATGEALGGHMRHRGGGGGGSPTVNETTNHNTPVVKKSKSRRILSLDLNLTPLENDFLLGVHQVTPPLNCFL